MSHTPTYRLRSVVLAAITLAASLSAGPAFAGDDHDHGSPAETTATATSPSPSPSPSPSSAAELSQGEVVRWDASTGKVTLRHGPIHNLEMPAMTMVFRVADPAQAAAIQPGAKVRFRAEKRSGAYVVTRIEAATTP